MRNLIGAALAAAMVTGFGGGALGESTKANPNAPGQNRVCLVTTKNPGSFNDVDVSDTKWLPRKAAEQQASKNPSTLRVFDYTNDPLVKNGTYASAEALCKTHFNRS
jgi:hypothetical protein